jgi:hypothetical protein
LFVCEPHAWAQRIAAEENVRALAARLDSQPGDRPLACEVQPLRPALNFGFRFQAGYFFRLPLNLSDGGRHRWVALTRIVSEDEGARPVYLIAYGRIPSGRQPTKAHAEAAGAFWIGEGRYNVKWLLVDDQGRICRKEWHMEAALARSDRKIKLTIPHGSVAELSWKGFADPDRQPDGRTPERLTVLLDAAPRRVRRTSQANLNPGDQLQLLGALSELLQDIPSPSVRLVVFSLEQQKELFRRDDFHLQDLDQVADSLNSVALGKVDSRVLRDQGGRVHLVSDLLNREISESSRASLVIVLGPTERFSEKFPAEALEQSPQEGQRFFYLQYKPAPRLVPGVGGFDMSQATLETAQPTLAFDSGAGSSDLIRSAIKRLQGDTFTIYTPGQFAKAVERIQRTVAHPDSQ